MHPIAEADKQKPEYAHSINERYVKAFGQSWLSYGETSTKKILIKDLPFMVTYDGTIVCLPKQKEQAVTALIGIPGQGKTVCAGYILDGIFYLWCDYIGIINDSQEETFDWSEPCDFNGFTKKLRVVNQSPMPLPMVYLFPKMYMAKEEMIKDKNYISISMPFREVINNIERFIPNLGNSERYLLMKRDELFEAETENEIFDIIKSINDGGKGMAEVVKKIDAAFHELIDEGILNISDLSVPSFLKVGDYIGNPFTAIMKADCVPSFITSDLYVQKYKDLIFSYYINSMFRESLKGEMMGKRVWLYFDELTKVVSSNQRNTSPETERSLNQVIARGRNNGISIIYATQRYKEIPKSMRELTKNAIVFRHNSRDETKEICDDFGVDKSMRGELLALKKFEAIAFTNEHFICYKKDKVWEESKPIKGVILPALHKNRFLHKQLKGGE